MVSESGTAVQTEYYLWIFASRKYIISPKRTIRQTKYACAIRLQASSLSSSVAFNDEFHMCGSFWIISI